MVLHFESLENICVIYSMSLEDINEEYILHC